MYCYTVYASNKESNHFIINVVRNITEWFTNSKFYHAETWFKAPANYKISLPSGGEFKIKKGETYISSITKKGHILYTLEKYEEFRKKENFTGQLTALKWEAVDTLFFEDLERLMQNTKKYTLVWSFFSALDNKLQKRGINMFKYLSKVFNLGKIYSIKDFCSATEFVRRFFSGVKKIFEGTLDEAKAKGLSMSPQDDYEFLKPHALEEFILATFYEGKIANNNIKNIK
ncbi:MAG: hypothetical protein EBU90_19950 [Proteobacteria bacterium]|nr:hypothetical protein [Pseudomonadota bacterium]